MSGAWIVFGFFVSVMAMVVAGGWLILLRFAPSEPRAADYTDAEASGLERAILSIGQLLPAAGRADNPVRRRLTAAGYRNPSALAMYYGVRCAASAAFALVLCGLSMIAQGRWTAALVPGAAGAAFGYLLPSRYLAAAARKRRDRIVRALPAALDLSVLSLESGQTLEQALIESSRSLARSCPDLAGELEIVYLETRASNDRAAALRNFADRTGEPEARRFAALLSDADRFGTSIVPALRNHSRYLRQRLRQTAYVSARKVSVKLIFPVFFLIFPAVMLVTLGPAVIMVFTQLRALLGG